MFRNAPDDVIQILATEQVTPNFHRFCLTKTLNKQHGLSETWKVLSVNDDVNGLQFISTMEHTTYVDSNLIEAITHLTFAHFRYPFFGVQFHPEKNIYEWIRSRNITHTSNAIKAAQYFATFFVGQSRRNHNIFPGGVEEENTVLIYNYPTNFTALVKSAYQQVYLFDEHADYRKFEGDSGSMLQSMVTTTIIFTGTLTIYTLLIN